MRVFFTASNVVEVVQVELHLLIGESMYGEIVKAVVKTPSLQLRRAKPGWEA